MNEKVDVTSGGIGVRNVVCLEPECRSRFDCGHQGSNWRTRALLPSVGGHHSHTAEQQLWLASFALVLFHHTKAGPLLSLIPCSLQFTINYKHNKFIAHISTSFLSRTRPFCTYFCTLLNSPAFQFHLFFSIVTSEISTQPYQNGGYAAASSCWFYWR